MWRNRNEVDAAKCKSYLFTVAYHQMIDHIRKNKRIHLKEEFNEEARIQDRPAHNMKKILEEAQRPFTAIMGGAKISDKILIIEKLLDANIGRV